MAENTEEYKVRIDTEVTGAENVDLLNRTIKTSIGDFDNLNEAISKTQDTLGKLDPKKDAEKFKELSKELSGLKDRLKETEVQSVRFTEALAAQPGVIGFVGQSLEGLRGTFKVFMANPIIAVLAGIAGAFLALRESLTRTEEGQAKLTKITEGFTKILNGLFAIIEPIAMQLADLVGGLLENEKVMNGLSKTVGVLTGVFTTLFGTLKTTATFIIDTLVNNFNTLIKVAKGAGDVIAGVFTFDWDRVKEGANAAFDAVKEGVSNTVDNVKDLGKGIADSAVAGFKAGEKSFKEGFKRLTKTQTEEQKKAQEERQKLLEEAEKIQTEAYLSLLDERRRAILEREQKFNEDKKKLIEAGITDFTDLEQSFNNDIREINLQYSVKITAERIDNIDTRFSEIESTTNAGYDELIGLIDEKEQLLLQQSLDTQNQLLENQSLSQEEQNRIIQSGELERSKIILDARNQRKGIQDKETADILLGLDNRTQEIISKENINTQELLSIVDERERILLENTLLTENERTRIRQEADAERAQIVQDDIDRRLNAFQQEYDSLALSFDARRELINEKEQELLADEKLTEEQRTELRRQFAEQRKVIAEQEQDVEQQKTEALIGLASQLGSFLQEVAGESKGIAIAGLVIEKAAAVAQIIASTAIANAKAVAAFPLTLGQPWVGINTASAALSIASLIAATAKGISEIKSASTKSQGGSSGSSSGSNLPKPSAPRAGGAPAIQAAGTTENETENTNREETQRTTIPRVDRTPIPEENTNRQETQRTTIPKVDRTPIPKVDRTPIPEVDRTPIPEVDRTPIPKVDRTPIPKVERTPIPKVERTPIPQVERVKEINTTTQIVQTIEKAREQKPIRAYVVSGEVSSAQALDRRTNRAATFTGGN